MNKKQNIQLLIVFNSNLLFKSNIEMFLSILYLECIDTLWELFEKVQYSLENGIQTVGEASRKYANLMAGLKQMQSIWHKFLATNEQKRRSIAPSSMVCSLHSSLYFYVRPFSWTIL